MIRNVSRLFPVVTSRERVQRLRTVAIVFIGWCAGFVSTRDQLPTRLAGVAFFVAWAGVVLWLWHRESLAFQRALADEGEKRKRLCSAVATYGEQTDARETRMELEISLLRREAWRRSGPRGLTAIAAQMAKENQ